MGTCEPSCADVTCDAGEICRSGVCVTDLCADASCAVTEACDPATGDCVTSMCGGVSCPDSTTCNPVTGACDPDRCIGVTCPDGQECVAGECQTEVIDPDAGTALVDAGGGGCLCAVPGNSRSHAPLAWGSLLALGALLATRRRRR